MLAGHMIRAHDKKVYYIHTNYTHLYYIEIGLLFCSREVITYSK